MRILAGKYKGRSLKTFSERSIRPTCGLVKESLFNICAVYLEGADFLDLFAGVGSIGFEALSRGASRVVFVDNSLQAVRLIHANSQLLGVEDAVMVMKHEAYVAVQRLAKKHLSFDLIYIDPPYDLDSSYIEGLLRSIATHALLRQGGLLFLENSSREEIAVEGLSLRKRRKFGNTFLSEYVCTA